MFIFITNMIKTNSTQVDETYEHASVSQLLLVLAHIGVLITFTYLCLGQF